MLMIILIILLFASLVILHEWGHFIMAKRNGVDVDEFGIGFPPKMWGRMVGKTLYSINWLPLGGFVRLAGEDSADTRPGTFGAAKLGAKTKILLAGVVMNLITAFVILYVVCLVGLPGLGAPFEPSFLHPAYAQPKQVILTQVEPGSPAAKAGLKTGDYVLSGNGKSFTTEDQLHNFTKQYAGRVVTFSVKSQGAVHNVTVHLRNPGTTQGYLGVSGQQVYKLKYGILGSAAAAAWITLTLFWATIVGVVELILSIPLLIIDLFGKTVPQAAAAASGPVGIFFILKSISVLGFSYIFLFMANIAVALAAFNVLPLPALDGGRLALILWQRVSGRTLSAETEARIHGIGFMVLIGFVVLISVYDLRKYY